MNARDKQCLGKTLNIIGSKWTVFLLHELTGGTRRFGELERALDGISPRTLSLRLRKLEHAGIVKKKLYAEVPPHAEYSLTDKGKSLRGIIRNIHIWGKGRSV